MTDQKDSEIRTMDTIPDVSDVSLDTFWGRYTVLCAIDRAKRLGNREQEK